jgi:hypothetical protein
MKAKPVILCASAVLLMLSSVFALDVTLPEYKSAMIEPQPTPKAQSYGGCYVSNVNPALGPMYAPADCVAGYTYATALFLWQFNLINYTGRVVTGDATLTLEQNWGDNFAHNARLYEPLSNWNETVVTWQNWLGPEMTNPAAFNVRFTNEFVGPELFVYDVPVGTVPLYWTVPSNTVQRWLDDPNSNLGILIKPDGSFNKMLKNRAWWNTAQRPKFTFNLGSNNLKPNTPTNKTPVNAAIAQPRNGVVLTASPFVDPNGNGHSDSQWQVSADPSFLAPAWDSQPIAASTVTTVAVTLQYQTRYYWRVRYRDNNSVEGPEWSDWSAPTYFDTQLNLIAPVVLIESQSAMIRPGINANTNVNGGTVFSFNLINPVTNVAPAGFNMYWFDMRVFSMYTGLVVSASGSLEVSTDWAIDPITKPTMALYPLNSAWLETNVTWNNYIGPDWSLWANQLGPELSSVLVDEINKTFTWTVSSAVLQGWLNHATNNSGMALVPSPSTGTGNVGLKTRRATPPPTLKFDITYAGAPTPSMPTNVAPANGAPVGLAGVTLNASAYNDPSATPQVASQWQIALDSSMQDVIWDTGSSTSALASVLVPAGVLTNTTRYYWHVRYVNQLAGKSSYSAATYFDTPIVGGVIVKRAAQAAMIMYTTPTQNWNSAGNVTFNMINPSNGVPGGPIMLWFDLGIFQGQGGILASNPAISVQLNWVEQIVALNFELHEVLAPWSENSVTWDGFVGADPATLTNLLLGPSLAVQQLPVEVDSTCTWAFSETVIQNILDGVTTNYGFAILPTGGGNAQIYSRQNPVRAPYLTVDIVPEPLAGLAAAVLTLGLLRRRA